MKEDCRVRLMKENKKYGPKFNCEKERMVILVGFSK